MEATKKSGVRSAALFPDLAGALIRCALPKVTSFPRKRESTDVVPCFRGGDDIPGLSFPWVGRRPMATRNDSAFQSTQDGRATRNSESGTSLMETLIAAVILLVGVVSVMSLMGISIAQSMSQGDVQTRVSEYAEDKMEQLLALSFADGSTNTTVFPPTSTGGTGLGGIMAANATVGGTTLSSPVSGYVDYLDISGNLLTSSTNAYYERTWSISTDSTGNLKTITVNVGATDLTLVASPTTTLVCIKTNVP